MFWSEPVLRSGSGSTLGKTDEILYDIFFVSSHIDERLFKKQILNINEIFLVRKKECCI